MKRTILLVDDEVDILETMSILLEEEYRVLTAERGDQAMGLLESEPVDMVIADQRMPGMPGVELLARVREMRPETVRLILTGYTDFDAMLTAINEGRVYRYIIKPWDEKDMRVTIRQALEWKDLQADQGLLAAEIAEANQALTRRNRKLEQANETIMQQEKLAAVGRFAAEMTHEMNNHVQIIQGYNESSAKSIEEQAKLLVWIASDIRDFALGATMRFSPKLTDPLEIVENVIRACKHHPIFLGIGLQLEKGKLEPLRLDPRQMKHLLFNLLKNAAKASSPDGGIVVRMEVDNELLIQVIDHGVGISTGLKSKIFEPFITNDHDGTGLGLSICRQVVQMHKGTIDCENTPGGGTTFTIRIPKSQDDPTASVIPA
jgi:signal transduction histidine kinase